MAEALVLWEFVGQDKLIEDTGSHKDGLTCAHGQRKDVVGVGASVGTHLPVEALVLLLGCLLHDVELGLACAIADAAALELAGVVSPVLKDLVDLSVL